MKIRFAALVALAATPIIVAGPVAAHITLANKTASPGTNYLATFKVPHGCGTAATTAIRIQIPTGVYSVKPMPHAGWKIDVVSGKYATPFSNGTTQMTEGVTQVNFTGGNLPDAYYDELTVSVSLADSLKKGTTVYFPVIQECEGGMVSRWISIPTAGKAEEGAETAPALQLQ